MFTDDHVEECGKLEINKSYSFKLDENPTRGELSQFTFRLVTKYEGRDFSALRNGLEVTITRHE